MAQEVEGQKPAPKGVFVTDGAEFSVHDLKITFGSEGVESSSMRITLRQDLCRHWLRIALAHLEDSAISNRDLLEAESLGNEKQMGTALEAEFQASMQAIVSSGIALDSLYTAVKERIEIPAELTEAWRTNGTARWKQMAEVLRRGFRLKDDAANDLRSSLEQITKYRDWAIHPPADQKRPVLREDIGRGVEWRFVAFRHTNAEAIVRLALGNIRVLAKKADLKPEGLQKYCEALSIAVEPLWTSFTEEYGGEQ